MICKDVDAAVPLHTAHSSARARHSGAPREQPVLGNSDILPLDFENVVPLQSYNICVNYKVPKLSISILHPARGRRVPHINMLANMNLYFKFPKDTWPPEPPADSKGWAVSWAGRQVHQQQEIQEN